MICQDLIKLMKHKVAPVHQRRELQRGSRHLPERFDAGVLILVDAEMLPLQEAPVAVRARVLTTLVGAAVLLVGVQRTQVFAAPLHWTPASRRRRRLSGWRMQKK